MDIGIIASRYAKALFAFATDNREEDVVYHEMTALSAAFARVERLQQVLQSPVLTEDKQNDLILAAARIGSTPPSSTLRRFVLLVVHRKRVDLMQFIAQSYIAAYRRRKHLISGRLVVARPVGKEVTQRMRQVVERKTDCQIEFDIVEDPTIKGGFILEYDTYRLDASLQTQLKRLERELA